MSLTGSISLTESIPTPTHWVKLLRSHDQGQISGSDEVRTSFIETPTRWKQNFSNSTSSTSEQGNTCQSSLRITLKSTKVEELNKSSDCTNPEENNKTLVQSNDQNSPIAQKHPRKDLNRSESTAGHWNPALGSATSKVVLRRWLSENKEREDTSLKRHSSPFLQDKKENSVFRPVSSLLSRTPWEKDFKASKSKSIDTLDGTKSRSISIFDEKKDSNKSSIEQLVNQKNLFEKEQPNNKLNNAIQDCLHLQEDGYLTKPAFTRASPIAGLSTKPEQDNSGDLLLESVNLSAEGGNVNDSSPSLINYEKPSQKQAAVKTCKGTETHETDTAFNLASREDLHGNKNNTSTNSRHNIESGETDEMSLSSRSSYLTSRTSGGSYQTSYDTSRKSLGLTLQRGYTFDSISTSSYSGGYSGSLSSTYGSRTSNLSSYTARRPSLTDSTLYGGYSSTSASSRLRTTSDRAYDTGYYGTRARTSSYDFSDDIFYGSSSTRRSSIDRSGESSFYSTSITSPTYKKYSPPGTRKQTRTTSVSSEVSSGYGTDSLRRYRRYSEKEAGYISHYRPSDFLRGSTARASDGSSLGKYSASAAGISSLTSYKGYDTSKKYSSSKTSSYSSSLPTDRYHFSFRDTESTLSSRLSSSEREKTEDVSSSVSSRTYDRDGLKQYLPSKEIGTSASVTSKDTSYTPETTPVRAKEGQDDKQPLTRRVSSGRLVKVESSYVGQSPSSVQSKEKDAERKMADRMSSPGPKDSTEKEAPAPRERRSSLLRRSFRRKSKGSLFDEPSKSEETKRSESPEHQPSGLSRLKSSIKKRGVKEKNDDIDKSKQEDKEKAVAAEESSEVKQKPEQRERRRSLLWRLGSKKERHPSTDDTPQDDQAEPVRSDKSEQSSQSVNDTPAADQPIRKSDERRLSGYLHLRRSSKKKKSPEPEKEAEKDEVKQSETTANTYETSSVVKKESNVGVVDKPAQTSTPLEKQFDRPVSPTKPLGDESSAPLAQRETYDDDNDIKPVAKTKETDDGKAFVTRRTSSKTHDSPRSTDRKVVPQEKIQTSVKRSGKSFDSVPTTSRKIVTPEKTQATVKPVGKPYDPASSITRRTPPEKAQTAGRSTGSTGLSLKSKEIRSQATDSKRTTASSPTSKLKQNDPGLSAKSIEVSHLKQAGNEVGRPALATVPSKTDQNDIRSIQMTVSSNLKPDDKTSKVAVKTVGDTKEEKNDQLPLSHPEESEKGLQKDLIRSSVDTSTLKKEAEAVKGQEVKSSVIEEISSLNIMEVSSKDGVDFANKDNLKANGELKKGIEITGILHTNGTDSPVNQDSKVSDNNTEITKISGGNCEKLSAKGKKQLQRKERRMHRAVTIDPSDIALVKQQLKEGQAESAEKSTGVVSKSEPSVDKTDDKTDTEKVKQVSQVGKVSAEPVKRQMTLDSLPTKSSDKSDGTSEDTTLEFKLDFKTSADQSRDKVKRTSRRRVVRPTEDEEATPTTTAVEKKSPFGVISKYIFHKQPSEDEKKKAVIDDKPRDSKVKQRDTVSSRSLDKKDTTENGTAKILESEKPEQAVNKSEVSGSADGIDGNGRSWTTRSNIKDKIRQKKSKIEHTKSLPFDIELTITGASSNEASPQVSRRPGPSLLSYPVLEKDEKDRDTSKDDTAIKKKVQKKPPRPRPKTLTTGIDPSLLFTANDESNVVEESLSISQIKERLMTESARTTPKTPSSERKNRRRSGKRYKTITEGIAPGILEAAHHYNDSEKLQQDSLKISRISAALTASTENLKRRSFVVSEVSSVIGSLGTSVATSLEDLSKIGDSEPPSRRGGTTTPVFGSMEDPLMALKKLPIMLEAGDEEGELPSVSALRDKFLKNVEDSYKKPENRSTVRRKFKRDRKDRPHTISGLDEFTMNQIEKEIESKLQPTPAESLTDLHKRDNEDDQKQKTKDETRTKRNSQIPIIDDDEIEKALKESGVSADELAAELGLNPSLSTVTKDSLSSETSVPSDKQGLNGEKKRRHGVIHDGLSVDVDNKENKEPLSDMDFVSQQSSQLTSLTSNLRSIRPQRKQKSSSNPVKALQARDDLRTETDDKKDAKKTTEEPATYRGAGRPSIKSAGQKLWRKVALANEAQAALAVKEDFSSVKLKKVKTPEEGKSDTEAANVQETKITKLLLLVKGRRHVQTKVAEFCGASISTHDSFVIVTPKELYCWHGKGANVIEKAKAAEVASRIHQKKEMGCKALDVVYVEENHPNESRAWRAMELEEKPKVNKVEETADEDYEQNMISCNMVYRLQDSDPPELVPDLTQCNRMPSKEILKTNEAFVLDFVSEVYVWVGRQTTSVLRRKIQVLGRKKFDEGYYFPEELLSTQQQHHHHHGKSRKISISEGQGRRSSTTRKISIQMYRHEKEHLRPRPPHAIFVILFENAEWVIFKEKFCDWPDESRIIRMKGGPQARGELNKQVAAADVKPVDPKTMVEVEGGNKAVEPVFEGVEIGRGQGKPKGYEGQHIITRHIQVWHVSESQFVELPPECHGQFHSSEGFVVRWEYAIVTTRVLKMLNDINEAKNSGRHKCAYFFWLGNDCPITEKGATAVMTVELDKERGPQIRVVQGKEPPCFLNLFNGGMIIHAGKRPFPGIRRNFTDRSLVRLYCVRNEETNEACLLQVPVRAESLRSRSSFVLLLCSEGEIFLWHGCKSSDSTRNTAIQAAHRLIENHPTEASLSEREEIFLSEIEEGHEPEVFWVALGGEEDYGTLLHEVQQYWDFTPRLFSMTSATGEFIANEITNPSVSESCSCPFPFLQDDLYDADQPAIFILDAHFEVYLWLGWFPDDEETETNQSQRRRWDIDKRKAMESTLLYCEEVNRPLSHTYVVYAGLEPTSFTHLFPYWIVQEDITDIQLEENLSSERKLISEELQLFAKDTYTLEELKRRPLPQGVDPTKLESYLSNEDFQHCEGGVITWSGMKLRQRAREITVINLLKLPRQPKIGELEYNGKFRTQLSMVTGTRNVK